MHHNIILKYRVYQGTEEHTYNLVFSVINSNCVNLFTYYTYYKNKNTLNFITQLYRATERSSE